MKKSAILLVMLLSCGLTTMAQDAKQILRHASGLYASANTYDFAAVNEMTFEVAGVKYKLNVRWEVARGATPDLPITKQTRGFAFTEPVGEGVKYPNIALSFAYDPARFSDDVKSARVVREETAEADGKSLRCFVIEVQHLPSGNNAKGEPPLETVWIDKATSLIVRLSYKWVQPAVKSQAPFEVDSNFTFNSFKFNTDPPVWLVTANADFAKESSKRREAKIGTSAPDFTLRDLNGKGFSLSSLKNRVILLEFWDTWCAPCRAEIPIVAKLERDWAGKGLVIVRITDESADDVRAFQKDTRQSFNTLVDAGGVLTQYHIFARPVIIIIDKMGTLSAYDETLLSEAQLVERLRKAGLY